MKLYRQGDVLLRLVDAIPDNGKRVESGVLAEGEATGHLHRIEDMEAAELLDCSDGLFLRVGPGGASIVHEEHAALPLPKGNYSVLRQSEYTPAAVRPVAD